MKYKKTVIILVILAVASGSLWWFTMKTNRGSSWSLYTFAAWGTPISTKLKCADQTDQNVKEKFELPFHVDESLKDALRGFWYYSYFRECLYEQGYDFDGEPIIPTTFTSTDTGVEYTNYQADILVTLPSGSTLLQDNYLDVDFDDRLFQSKLSIGTTTVTLNTYSHDNDISSFEILKSDITHLSATEGTILKKISLTNQNNISYVSITQDDGLYGNVLFTPDAHIVHIYGTLSSQYLIQEITENARFHSMD